MDRVSFPLIYFKIEPWNADPTLTNQMQSSNNLVFFAVQAIFLFFEEVSWASCEHFLWLF